MEEIALHIMDLVENSIRAGAALIKITIDEQLASDRMILEIEDNGPGMNEQELKQAQNAFYTTKPDKQVGLGLPLFVQACERAGGTVRIESEGGRGMKVRAEFVHSHIDRQPLGALGETLVSLITTNWDREFVFSHQRDGEQFCFDSRELKSASPELDFMDYYRQVKGKFEHYHLGGS